MFSDKGFLSPSRLCDAADAAMQAAIETARAIGVTFIPYPPDLMGRPIEPACLRGYDRLEIERATDFLSRLGVRFTPLARPDEAA